MATKPNAGQCVLNEQIIDDPVSGLTIQFELNDDNTVRMKIFGDLPLGNREFVFDKNGNEAGAGTALSCPTRPSWLREVL